MLDKRRSPRRRTLLDGRIRVENQPIWAIDCAVRNLSDSGVRVSLSAGALVPHTFDLGIAGLEPRRVRLVWIRDGHAGLTMIDRNSSEPSL